MNPKITIWKCITCPAKCPLPFHEIYENPHVCMYDENVKAIFKLEEVNERELLAMYTTEKDNVL